MGKRRRISANSRSSNQPGAPSGTAPPLSAGPSELGWSGCQSGSGVRTLMPLILPYPVAWFRELRDIRPRRSPFLPSEPVVASLRAPVSMGHGYAWYPLVPESDHFPHEESATCQQQRAQGTRDHFSHEGSVEAVDAVLTWLNEHVGPATSVGLLGFSQGAAIAVELL